MRNRGIRHRLRRRNRASDFELDITSLLDILVILLIFLLQSYNSSGMVFQVQEGIVLPMSDSNRPNTAGVIVQVSPSTIYVDDSVVYDAGNRPPKTFDQEERRIIPLYNALVEKRENANLLNKNLQEKKQFSGVVNFVIDKTIGYNYVKKLMYTAGEAGYFKFNLVVLGEEI
jgi:biopolymer transport protein ExbD